METKQPSDIPTYSPRDLNFRYSPGQPFVISFPNDNLGPYDFKFARKDCYYDDSIHDRGSKMFPIRNRRFDTTEIFLEDDSIVICTGSRGGLLADARTFLDVINLKTQRKMRIFADEVDLIFNQRDSIVISYKQASKGTILTLDSETLSVKEEGEGELLAFFKCVYESSLYKWYLLDFQKTGSSHAEGYFTLKPTCINAIPDKFDRESFLLNGTIDIWRWSNETNDGIWEWSN